MCTLPLVSVSRHRRVRRGKSARAHIRSTICVRNRLPQSSRRGQHPTPSLFSRTDVERSSGLDRFAMMLFAIPDEPLVYALEARRGLGRDRCPVQQVCDFDPGQGLAAVPTSWAMSCFVTSVVEQRTLLEEMFAELGRAPWAQNRCRTGQLQDRPGLRLYAAHDPRSRHDARPYRSHARRHAGHRADCRPRRPPRGHALARRESTTTGWPSPRGHAGPSRRQRRASGDRRY